MNGLRVVDSTLALAVTVLIAFGAPGRCDEPPNAPTPPADRAKEFMRREVQRDVAARDAYFQRIAGLPAPPEPEPVVRMLARNNVVLVFRLKADERAISPRTHPSDPVVEDEEADPVADVEADEGLEIADVTFDLYVFGNMEGVESSATLLERRLEARVRQIAQSQGLSDAEQQRLILAGRGDIKRLLERVAASRRTFESLKSDTDKCSEFLRTLHPLNGEVRRGPFGSGSMLDKTLRTIQKKVSAHVGKS